MPIGSRWGMNIQLPGEVELKPPSSIDRFFWSKGVSMLGYRGNQWLALAIVGGSTGIATIVMTILKLCIAGFPVALPFVFGGATLMTLIFATLMYLGRRNAPQSEVKISAAGRQLLFRIGQHIGWHDQDAYQPRPNRGWGAWWQSIVGVHTASDVMKPLSADLMEQGSAQYNRLAGLIKLGKTSKVGINTWLPQVQAAGDEAMISLINQVALLEANPETASAVEPQGRNQVANLKELADRFEEKISSPATIADRLSSTTVMDNVLDQLRLDAQAHEELRVMDRLDQ